MKNTIRKVGKATYTINNGTELCKVQQLKFMPPKANLYDCRVYYYREKKNDVYISSRSDEFSTEFAVAIFRLGGYMYLVIGNTIWKTADGLGGMSIPEIAIAIHYNIGAYETILK